jgi:hypothetical protein
MEKYELVKDIEVMYVPAQTFPDGIVTAFKKLERKLASLNDRIFFGLSWPDKNGNILYKAADEEKYSGEGKKYELDHFTIRKGTYLTKLAKHYKKDLRQIGDVFQQLLDHPELDTNSYCLEWYKGDDVLCLVKLDPLKAAQTNNKVLKRNR